MPYRPAVLARMIAGGLPLGRSRRVLGGGIGEMYYYTCGQSTGKAMIDINRVEQKGTAQICFLVGIRWRRRRKGLKICGVSESTDISIACRWMVSTYPC